MGMLQAEATVSSATDTELIANPEAGHHVVVHEFSAATFIVHSTGKSRFEAGAGGAVLAGLGVLSGVVIGNSIHKSFPNGYNLPTAKGISIESTDTATCYFYVKYSVRRD